MLWLLHVGAEGSTWDTRLGRVHYADIIVSGSETLMLYYLLCARYRLYREMYSLIPSRSDVYFGVHPSWS